MCYVTIYSNFSYLCEKLRVSALDPLHLKRLASIRDRLRLNHTYCNSTGFENQTGKARSGTKTTVHYCAEALRASLEPRCAMGLWHKRGPDQGRFLARHQWE